MSVVYVGNLESRTRVKDLEHTFTKYVGPVQKIDRKPNFAFVFLENSRDAERAIRKLDGYRFNHRTIRVEKARGDGAIKKREEDRRKDAQSTPSDTLFVVNFDTSRTDADDLRHLFRRYGEIKRVEKKSNFAFVQYATVEEATDAMKSLNGKIVHDREITVEYMASRRYPGRFSSPRRGRSRSPSPERGRERERERERDPYAPYEPPSGSAPVISRNIARKSTNSRDRSRSPSRSRSRSR